MAAQQIAEFDADRFRRLAKSTSDAFHPMRVLLVPYGWTHATPPTGTTP